MEMTIDLSCANCGEAKDIKVEENCGTYWIECKKCKRNSAFSPNIILCDLEDI